MLVNLTRATTMALLLAACGARDADGDGLSDAEERELGTDPRVADTDGDGLSDAEEVEFGSNPLLADTDGDRLGDWHERDLGTDPNAFDSDGDTYADGDEVTEGKDPLDADSRIYVGYWPYRWDKDALESPGLTGPRSPGSTVPRRSGVDQFGDTFDLYDLSGHGKPVVVTFSAEWCGPCRSMARWLAGQSNEYSEFNPVRRAVNEGRVLWVTVLVENSQGREATEETTANWYASYTNERAIVMVDRGKRLSDWSEMIYFPTEMWVDDQMEIQVHNPNNPGRALAQLTTHLATLE